MKNFKSNRNVVYSCKYHIVWTPKYRRPVLTNDVEIRLEELLKQIALQIQVEIIEMEIMPDHVHLLIEVDPQFGIHKAVKRFKGASSRYLRQEFPHLKSRLPTMRTNSYASLYGRRCAKAFIVKQYIQNLQGGLTGNKFPTGLPHS